MGLLDSLNVREALVVNAIIKNPGMKEEDLFKSIKMKVRDGRTILKRPIVKAVLDNMKERASQEALISCKRVMEEESCIAFADPIDLKDENGELLPIEKLPERLRRALSVTVKEIEKINKNGTLSVIGREVFYTLMNKQAALERISKHLGLYERDNAQRAIPIFFVSPDDENLPKDKETVQEAEVLLEEEQSDKPIALLE